MKTKRLFPLLALFVLTAAGCEQNEAPYAPRTTEGEGLVIGIAPAKTGSRAVLLGDDEDGNEAKVAEFESRIVEFTVYLFDETGTFLEQQSTYGSKAMSFPGYSEGDKLQVVAYANTKAAGITLPVLKTEAEVEEPEKASTIADIAAAASTVELSSQIFSSDDMGALLGLISVDELAEIDPSILDKALVMSGRYGAGTKGNLDDSDAVDPIFTVGTDGYLITVPVERIVAKVTMGKIEFGENVSFADLIQFNVEQVGVSQAIAQSYLYPGEITTYPANPGYYSAFEGGTVSSFLPALNDMGDSSDGLLNVSDLLSDKLPDIIDGVVGNVPLAGPVLAPILNGLLETLGREAMVDQILNGTLTGVDRLLSVLDMPLGAVLGALQLDIVELGDLLGGPNNFWYVLPNPVDPANPDLNPSPTLLTLKGRFGGRSYFYPIEINTTAGNGMDGMGIKRNTKYEINVKFESAFDTGTDDPDDPDKRMALKVTVNAVDWEIAPVQNATW